MVNEIRTIFAGFDWEYHDRQLALEAIERIVTDQDQGQAVSGPTGSMIHVNVSDTDVVTARMPYSYEQKSMGIGWVPLLVITRQGGAVELYDATKHVAVCVDSPSPEPESDPFGPDAYKSHSPGCQCWDCRAAREVADPADAADPDFVPGFGPVPGSGLGLDPEPEYPGQQPPPDDLF